jgi:cytochrome c556
MKFFAKAVFVSALAVASVVYAEATDPTVKARQELMKTIGSNVKALGDMAGGKVAYDAAAAGAAKAALVAAAAEIPAKFETQATDPDSEAKAEIWTGWDDFVKKAGALGTAAGAMDVASVETIGAGMGAIGGACKDCHTTFRAQK